MTCNHNDPYIYRGRSRYCRTCRRERGYSPKGRSWSRLHRDQLPWRIMEHLDSYRFDGIVVTPSELEAFVGADVESIRRALYRLQRRGWVVKAGVGRWRLAVSS